MNPYNRTLTEDVIDAIDRFVAGELSIADVQGRLQSAAQLFENEPASPSHAIRVTEADLEEIQFARLLDEQRPAAAFRLDELRALLADALAGACGA
jgi:hypothetical protein